MENKKLTEIVIVLDESGSMSDIQDDTIGGLNNFIREQQKEPGSANLTLVKFNHKYNTVYSSIDINEVKKINSKTYTPSGTTALLDAVGTTIGDISFRINARKHEDKPDRLLFVIITDGYENSSQEYDFKTISNLIKEKEKKDWVFSYLGADIDNFDDANNLAMANSAIISKKDMIGNFNTMSTYTTNIRGAENVKEVSFSDYFDDKKGKDNKTAENNK